MATHDRADAAADPLDVVHVIPHVSVKFGGSTGAMVAVAHEQVARGHRVTIVATPLADDGPRAELVPQIDLVLEPARNFFGFRLCPPIAAKLDALARKAHLFHSHLLWTDCHRQAARISRRRGLPHVIQVHGTLMSAALGHRRFKKWPAAYGFQNRALREAALLVASTADEAAAIRDYGLTNPVATIPNMVRYPGPPAPENLDAYRRRHELSPAVRRALFVGRLHPIKGLERLVRGWGELGEAAAGWELVIAGPDASDHRAHLERVVAALGISATVRFPGPLTAADKWTAMHDAELFVLPSDSENFGISAVEAMFAGRPVIATRGTPWRALEQTGAGWWVEPSPAALAAALGEAMAMAPEQRRRSGRAARGLADRYATARVMRDWDRAYAWVVGRGARPEFVRGPGDRDA